MRAASHWPQYPMGHQPQGLELRRKFRTSSFRRRSMTPCNWVDNSSNCFYGHQAKATLCITVFFGERHKLRAMGASRSEEVGTNHEADWSSVPSNSGWRGPTVVSKASTILTSLTGVVLEIMRCQRSNRPKATFQIRQVFGQNVVIDDHPSGDLTVLIAPIR